MKWIVEYDNDTGPHDEGYSEWWMVRQDDTRGGLSFKAYDKESAERLCEILNKEWVC